MVAEDKPGARKLYQKLLDDLFAHPELLEPIEDIPVLIRHSELVETILATIFPPSTSSYEGIFAVCYPFHTETIFSSKKFKELFLKDESNQISVPDRETSVSIAKASLSLAYNVILRKFYSLPVPVIASSVHPFTDPDSGLTTYLELNLNAQFVTVKCTNPDFSLPAGFSPQRTLNIDDLKEAFPIENFQFEGLVVIDVADVTAEQAIIEIKNTLLNINASSDVTVYADLQPHVQTLIGLKEIQVGITPFFSMNDIYLYTEAHYTNSILFKNDKALARKEKISALCHNVFKNNDQPILFQNLNGNSNYNELVNYYYELGAKSLIVCPLRCDNGDLIGLLEIMSGKAGALKFQHITRLQPAMQLFSLALEKTNENLELQIDKTIKQHFTAIQPAVEWKFTEAAFHYLQNRQVHEAAKMPPIAFENVYPLYGSIDIRNSSVERNNAIQLDLLEQLTMTKQVLEKATLLFVNFPLLKDIKYKIEKYIASTNDSLLSDDELQIYEFLQIEVDALFKHLRSTKPELKKTIDEYFGRLDNQRNILYHHRKDYEDSITRINDVLDRFIDQEQKAAQQVFPHYFERYITDGVEFNIYVGQALAPNQIFDDIYVKNLKLWQITMLAKAARLTNSLEKKLPLPLQTTQLILAHSIPLTISFRRKERKFDVDGAYNIRYEIIKKRIDKVYIKNSDERLTQPGKIAVVYSQQKELNEYMEYIEFLQHEKLLNDNLEHLELEDTQGISGLKAIRIDVNLNNENGNLKTEASRAGAKEVFRK